MFKIFSSKMLHAKVEPGHVGVPGLCVQVGAGLAGAAVSGQHGWDDPVPGVVARQQPRPEAEGAVRGDGVVTMRHHRQVHRCPHHRLQPVLGRSGLEKIPSL